MVTIAKTLNLAALAALILFTVSCDLFNAKPQQPSWELVSEENIIASSITEYGTLLYAKVDLSSRLFSSKDSGKTWLALGENAPRDIISYAVNQSGIWVATQDELFRSSDNGVSWVSIVTSRSLTNAFRQINSITVNGNEVFLATSRGFYYSSNQGSQWRLLNVVTPVPTALQIEVTNDGVFAQTFTNIYFSADRISWKAVQPALCSDCTLRIMDKNSSTIFLSITERESGRSFPTASNLLVAPHSSVVAPHSNVE